MSDIIGKTTIFLLSFVVYTVFVVIAMKIFPEITTKAFACSMAYIIFCSSKDSFFREIFFGELEKAIVLNFIILTVILFFASKCS